LYSQASGYVEFLADFYSGFEMVNSMPLKQIWGLLARREPCLLGSRVRTPTVEDGVDAGRVLGGLRLSLITLVFGAQMLPQTLGAQVGVPSNISQVALVARVPPTASITSVGPDRETSSTASLREVSVTVKGSTNAPYRLMVVRTGVPGGAARVWVRAPRGELQELAPGSSVTVAQAARSAGQWEHQVDYRLESEAGLGELPVRYEIVVNPGI
jgi:hypothetical protein